MNKLLLASTFAMLLLFGASVNAQTDETPTLYNEAEVHGEQRVTNYEAIMVADVNFSKVSTTTTDGELNINFTISSGSGSQDGISYGVIVRSQKNGALLSTKTEDETLALNPGVEKRLALSYSIPTYLNEAGDVYLAAYTKTGLPLAFSLLTSIPAGSSDVKCLNADGVVACDSKEGTNMTVSITEGSPQGEVVVTKEVELADDKASFQLEEITDDLKPGTYVASVVVKDEKGITVGTYVTEFAKAGTSAKIVNISPKPLNTNQLEVIVYATASGIDFNQASLVVGVGGQCGADQSIPFSGRAETLTFTTACKSGDVSVILMEGGNSLSSMTAQYVMPVEVVTTTEEDVLGMSSMNVFLIILLIILAMSLIGVIVLYVIKNKHNQSSEVPPSVPPFAMLIAFVLFGLIGFAPSTEAATYIIGNTVIYDACDTNEGGSRDNCISVYTEPGYTTYGRIVVPNSAYYNEPYLVSMEQSLTSNGGNTLCGGSPCTTGQVYTYVYYNVPPASFQPFPSPFEEYNGGNYYHTLAGGANAVMNISQPVLYHMPINTPTAGFFRTAPVSGSHDYLSFLQNAAGPGNPSVTSCTNTCLTFPFTYNSIAVPLTTRPPAPSVQVNF